MLQVCSALICGTALGDVFETGHNHKGKNILRLQPEEPPGDSSYGSHIGHAHAENRVDSDGMQGQGASNDNAEDRIGDKWQDLGGHHHHAEERGGDEGQDHHAGFDHEQRVDGHHEEGKFHRGIVEEDPENSHEQKRSKYFRKPELHQSLRQKDNHKEKNKDKHEHDGHHHEKDKHNDEHKGENKEQVMLEFVALESSLGGIHR